MKKITVLLAAAMLFTALFTGCANNAASEETTAADTATATETTSAEQTTYTVAESVTSPEQTTCATNTYNAAETSAVSSDETAAESTAAVSSETTPPTTTKPDTHGRTDGFSYNDEAKKAVTEYGIDADKREEYYSGLTAKASIPIIHISTENKARVMSREEYVNCLVDVLNGGEYEMQAAAGGIKVRGNSTAYYGDETQVAHNQVPYRIKFNAPENMLGLNDGAKCKSWVLLKATWQILPDYIAFKLADKIFGGDYYSSDCAMTLVYVNERLMGLYTLCEQNQINPNRVNINEVIKGYEGTDIGYFLEIDNYPDDEPYYFTVDYCGETLTDVEGTTRELFPAEYSLTSDIYSEEQYYFISDYISNVYYILIQAIKYEKYYTLDENNTLISAEGLYDNAYDAINAVLDINSTVDMYLLYEIVHDYDCGEGSFYMAVDFSKSSTMKRLTFTAPWDFNWAYEGKAIKKYYAAAFTDESFVNQYGDRSNPWFILLMSEDWYVELVKEKWAELQNSGALSAAVTEAQTTLDTYRNDFELANDTYSDNGQKLIKWVKTRIKWLDKEWLS